MESPRNTKEVQKLLERVAALNWFISRSMDKYLPFFHLLRKAFEWTEDCKEAFQKLKDHLASLPYCEELSPMIPYSYVVVSNSTVSLVLIKEKGRK